MKVKIIQEKTRKSIVSLTIFKFKHVMQKLENELKKTKSDTCAGIKVVVTTA